MCNSTGLSLPGECLHAMLYCVIAIAAVPAAQELMQHKLVFIETTDVVETTLALDNFRRACDCGRGAIFFSVARGKVAEVRAACSLLEPALPSADIQRHPAHALTKPWHPAVRRTQPCPAMVAL